VIGDLLDGPLQLLAQMQYASVSVAQLLQCSVGEGGIERPRQFLLDPRTPVELGGVHEF
jgi:hypothetical protein